MAGNENETDMAGNEGDLEINWIRKDYAMTNCHFRISG